VNDEEGEGGDLGWWIGGVYEGGGGLKGEWEDGVVEVIVVG